ncbi:MAG: polyprenyl synthetase family protein [Candidatus Omnitrophica bacterium]|nr:polyprenyl synthetase family protein [Candidatus Omnitrophota bacterium]
MIEDLRKNIDKSLAVFLKTVQKDYKLHLASPLLFESIREFTLREGKRLRPLLLILTYKAYSPANKEISKELYNASTCMEFLHNFMLIHDDIIDRSDLRRGKPTLHKVLAHTVKTDNPEKLGIDLGIIAGDIVYALAIDAFLSIKEPLERKERALKYFIQTAAFTAMGEFIDTVFGVKRIDQITEKDVFLNYTLKTARYTFDCPMVTGAILAGAPERDIKKLSDFGILIGQAFQIQDDIIGIYETEKNIGKSILSDLAESKKTIMVVHAYKTLTGKQRAEFLKIFGKKTKTLKDLDIVKKIFIESGSLNYALKHVKSRLAKAKKIMAELDMNPEYRTLIEQSLLKLFAHSQRIVDLYQPGR